uniref:Uncharacterized protein n=1 Tax=Candidatus Methanogaster sp. ANME-2c ERB4 TaxID=2759911 RepID=A0A7G9Y5M6_9EURY|nr:hypothetical protein EFIOKIJN_00002 [Methanosarcinales archaeon ANME-2c ERB4]
MFPDIVLFASVLLLEYSIQMPLLLFDAVLLASVLSLLEYPSQMP